MKVPMNIVGHRNTRVNTEDMEESTEVWLPRVKLNYIERSINVALQLGTLCIQTSAFY